MAPGSPAPAIPGCAAPGTVAAGVAVTAASAVGVAGAVEVAVGGAVVAAGVAAGGAAVCADAVTANNTGNIAVAIPFRRAFVDRVMAKLSLSCRRGGENRLQSHVVDFYNFSQRRGGRRVCSLRDLRVSARKIILKFCCGIVCITHNFIILRRRRGFNSEKTCFGAYPGFRRKEKPAYLIFVIFEKDITIDF